MKRLYSLLLAVALLSWIAVPIVSFTGCTTNQQTLAYQTIYSLEVTTTATFDAYLTSVVKGKVSTANTAAIAQAYNEFQQALNAATQLVKGKVQAPASATLEAAAAKVTNLIAQAK